MSLALVSGVAEIFACRSVTLMLVERRSKLLVSQASYNGSPGAHTLMTSQEDPFVELLAERGRALPESEWPWGMTFASWLRDLKFVLAVPVVLGDELTGVLVVGERTGGGELRGEGRELLELLGSHVGTILENARLFESATTDALTGLQRRETVLGELDREIERAVRYRRPLTIAMADLDSFKAINDQHGHLAGDIMLRRAAQTVTKSLRSTDLVGRYGGEEFLILLPESETMGALQVVEKLRRAIESLRVEADSGEILSTTISIGLASIAGLPASVPLTAEALIEAADRSLYQAKQEGRNRVSVAG
jgi:diguanylate cyclase (GGDEF)-like protein